MQILAIDLGKTNSVACVDDAGSGDHTFERLGTTPEELGALIERVCPDRLVIAAGPHTGWISDILGDHDIELQVAVTTGPAWRWRNNSPSSNGP